MVTRRALLAFLCGAAFAATPQRIISTAPSITEMLYAVGLGDKVVGVTTYCHYPPAARSKPKIGTYTEPNLERIASLRPDLVIIQKNPIQLAAKLEALKLKVLEVSHDTVDDVFVSMQRIADCRRSSGARPRGGRRLAPAACGRPHPHRGTAPQANDVHRRQVAQCDRGSDCRRAARPI